MNQNNNIFNENKIKNELKNFQEGSDYSVLRENDKKTYNFHSDILREILGRDNYTTVYEAAENWDSDNFNYHREAGEYVSGNRGRITYRYEHRINKNGDYHKEWSRNYIPWDRNEKHSWTLCGNPEPKRIEPIFNDNEVEMHRKYLAEFQEKKHNLEMINIEEQNNPKSCCEKHSQEWLKNPNRQKSIEERKKNIEVLETKIQYEKDWLAKNANGCDNNQSDLQKENHELRQQLSQVQQQLAEVLAELKKLKSNMNGESSVNQQIIRNERLIENGGSVSETEVRDQINKSEALMKEFNTTVEPTKNDKGNGSSPYLIGGSVILVAAGIIGYLLLKKKWRK